MTVHEQFAEDLALYALGTLEGDVCADLEAHLSECAECRRELQRLRGDVGLLGLSATGPAPPPHARARLMSAIAREPRTITFTRRRLQWWALAPLAAAVALAIFSISLWRRNDALRRDLAQLFVQLRQERTEIERAKEVLAVLTAPDAVRVTLRTANANPRPQGNAIYVARTGSLVFLASDFAAAPPEKAYELWLLPASGAAPIPAGIFKPDARGSASLLIPPLPKGVQAKAFAVTIEPEGGSTTPTMPIVLVLQIA
jgi:anti-sigma-K factor RskA